MKARARGRGGKGTARGADWRWSAALKGRLRELPGTEVVLRGSPGEILRPRPQDDEDAAWVRSRGQGLFRRFRQRGGKKGHSPFVRQGEQEWRCHQRDGFLAWRAASVDYRSGGCVLFPLTNEDALDCAKRERFVGSCCFPPNRELAGEAEGRTAKHEDRTRGQFRGRSYSRRTRE